MDLTESFLMSSWPMNLNYTPEISCATGSLKFIFFVFFFEDKLCDKLWVKMYKSQCSLRLSLGTECRSDLGET